MQSVNPPDAPARAKSTPMAQLMLESIVRGSKIVIFSFTYCDECHEAEKIFRSLKITEPDLRVVELDVPDMIADDSEHADEIVAALRTELEAQSGVNTMPQIFVGARHVGGLEALNTEWENGQLSLALQRCAVPFRGIGMQAGGRGGGGGGHRRRSTSVWDTPTMLPPMEPALCDKLRGLRRVIEFCAGHFEIDGIVLAQLAGSDDFRESLELEGGFRDSLGAGDASPAVEAVVAAGGSAKGVTSDTLPTWCAKALLSLATVHSDHIAVDDTLGDGAWVAAGLLAPQSTLQTPGSATAQLTMSGDFSAGLDRESFAILVHCHDASKRTEIEYKLNSLRHVASALLSELHEDSVGEDAAAAASRETARAMWSKLEAQGCRDFLHTDREPFDVGSLPAEKQDTVEQIAVLFESPTQGLLKRSGKDGEDQWDAQGRALFKAHVARFVAIDAPVLSVLPCFPFKSNNKERKVISPLPDMAEYVAIRRVHQFFEDLKTIYPPGGRMVLMSDGRVYNDCFQISNTNTSAFRDAVSQLFPTPNIVWTDMQEFIAGPTHPQTSAGLDNVFGEPSQVIEARIEGDQDTNWTYLGFKRFLHFELPDVVSESKKARRKRCGQVARRMMGRNGAYAMLIRLVFPHHVRFSIHPGQNVRKFGCNLVGHTHFGTPWHNVAVERADGSWELMHKEDAEREGLHLTQREEATLDGGSKVLPYYEEQSLVDKLLHECEAVLWRGGTHASPIVDLWDKVGAKELRQQLESFVETDHPLEFAILGFANKWPGHGKTLGVHADVGEEAALRTIVKFALRCAELHAPGARFNIVSGGALWHQVMGVHEESVLQYVNECKAMIRDLGGENVVHFVSFHDIFPGMDAAAIRTAIFQTREFLPDAHRWLGEQKAAADEAGGSGFRAKLAQFEGFARDINEVRALSPEPDAVSPRSTARKQHDEAAADDLSDAEALMVYSEIFRRFANKKFAECIRFSIRPTDNSLTKLGMNMIGPRQVELGHCVTPWHGVGIELADGSYVVAKKLHAEKLTGSAPFKKDPSSKLNHGYRVTGVDAARSVAELKALIEGTA